MGVPSETPAAASRDEQTRPGAASYAWVTYTHDDVMIRGSAICTKHFLCLHSVFYSCPSHKFKYSQNFIVVIQILHWFKILNFWKVWYLRILLWVHPILPPRSSAGRDRQAGCSATTDRGPWHGHGQQGRTHQTRNTQLFASGCPRFPPHSSLSPPPSSQLPRRWTNFTITSARTLRHVVLTTARIHCRPAQWAKTGATN